MKYIESDLLNRALSKGEIHFSCYKNSVFVSTFTPFCTTYQGRAFVAKSSFGIEHSLLLLLASIENSVDLIDYADSIFTHPVAVGKNTEFEDLLQVGSIHMMKLSGIKLHAQTTIPPSVFDLPGTYSRHGVGAVLDEAIKDILSNKWDLSKEQNICHAFNVHIYLNEYMLMKEERKVSGRIVVIEHRKVPPNGTRCMYCTELATEYDKEDKPVCGIPTNNLQ